MAVRCVHEWHRVSPIDLSIQFPRRHFRSASTYSDSGNQKRVHPPQPSSPRTTRPLKRPGHRWWFSTLAAGSHRSGVLLPDGMRLGGRGVMTERGRQTIMPERNSSVSKVRGNLFSVSNYMSHDRALPVPVVFSFHLRVISEENSNRGSWMNYLTSHRKIVSTSHVILFNH